MYSNKISENRESKGDKVENHDISLSHTFCEKKERKIFLFLWMEERLSISQKRITSFYFSKDKNVILISLNKEKSFIFFVKIIRTDNVL